MTTKKRNRISYICFRFIRFIVKVFYPKIEVEGTQNLPRDACIIVGNHTQMNGPICAEIHFPGKRKIWCAHQMMKLKEVPSYAFEDFWSRKPKIIRPFYKLLSYIIAPISTCVFNNAHTIPVYRDNRLMTTFRQTIDALKNNENVIIFPECYEPHNHIVNKFQENFIDIAKLYYKRTGKELSFVPLYIAPNLRKMYIGKPIKYCNNVPIEETRHCISTYLMDEITNIAINLPYHKVVPYANISRKLYNSNIQTEAKE